MTAHMVSANTQRRCLWCQWWPSHPPKLLGSCWECGPVGLLLAEVTKRWDTQASPVQVGGAWKKIVPASPETLSGEFPSFRALPKWFYLQHSPTCSGSLFVHPNITGFLLFSTQFLMNELVALFPLASPAGQLPLCQPSCYPAVWCCDQYITILLLPVFSLIDIY